MTVMRVTVRVEIETAHGASVVERTVCPEGFGGNPVFFAETAGQAAKVAGTQVSDALEAVYGTAPHPPHFSVPAG